jgi:UDP-N-acetylmuramoyl-L-alanyl-D-glutamate--2,6-diaminopimelate ligase
MIGLQTPQQAADWLLPRVHGQLQADSRKVREGDGFIARTGAHTDGRAHVGAAVAAGASACLVEQQGVEAFGFEGDAIASYPQLKGALAEIADAFYGHPSQRLRVLAVTGTNGKTSTAWWLAHALSGLRDTPIPCGVVGTLGVGQPMVDPVIGETVMQLSEPGLTTPDPVAVQQAFRRFADAGLQACAIEASSIGIVERRLHGTRIHTALFTNFTQDHLDYHGDMLAYWQAKAALFAWPGLQAAVVNLDDEKGAELAAALQTRGLDLWTVSCSAAANARLSANQVVYNPRGICFNVTEAGGATLPLQTQLIGQYNIANVLGVIGGMRSLGVSLAAAVQACAALTAVPGRMECLGGDGQPMVAVDYAHTPDALEKALAALRPMASQRGGQLWCVFGCGGDRDATKRPLMGAIAGRNADQVVVTSDNPRSEKPEAIICQILLGLAGHKAVTVESDRAQAIAATLAEAAAADVVLLAGKGHEDYQEIAGVRHAFSDRQQVQQALAKWPPSTKEGA